METCDRCGARATVHVVLQKGELFFCGHHYLQHVVKLQAVFVKLEVRDSFATKSQLIPA